MNVIEGAFEGSDTILFDHKRFSNIRTHPEELRVVKSKFSVFQQLYDVMYKRAAIQDQS